MTTRGIVKLQERFAQSFIRRIVMYASQSWTNRSNEKKYLESKKYGCDEGSEW